MCGYAEAVIADVNALVMFTMIQSFQCSNECNRLIDVISAKVVHFGKKQCFFD